MSLLKSLAGVAAFVFDVDGVLTDSTVLLAGDALQARRMSIKDGLSLQRAAAHHPVLVVSGAVSAPVIERLQYLGLTSIFTGVADKKAFVENFMQQQNIPLQNVLFMGDDLPDLALLLAVGVAACPADAVGEVIDASHYISRYGGGAGCVRDVIEKVLRLQGHWPVQTNLVSQ